MLSSETFYICELCRQRVDPGSPDVYRAAELVYVGTVSDPHALAEGRIVYFHRACCAGEMAGYRLINRT